jgi:hypothetical protein
MARHEIEILRAVGMSQRTVAAKTAQSVRRVRRIEREAPIATADTAALIERRKVGRPSTAAPWPGQVEASLREDQDLVADEMTARDVEAGHVQGRPQHPFHHLA